MKKIYLLALAVCAAVAGNAQLKQTPAAQGKTGLRGMPTATPANTSENRVVIWSNDFSNCDDWTTNDAFSSGNTDYIDGLDWQCGTTAPSGPASIDPIASTTADNGFMMIDSDLFGGETPANAWVENSWFQTANPIDVSAYDNISLRFQTFYRMWDNGSSDGNEYCLVEVSTDGVTWPDITTYEVSEADPGTRFELWPTMGTQDPVTNPTLKVFNISEVAGAADQIWLRFRWVGYWGYSWMVDDIELYETPANDLTILNNWCGDIINNFEYHAIPTGQVAETAFGVVLANYGYNDNEATATFTVNGTDVYTATGTILAGTIDTLWTAAFTPSSDLGNYDVVVTVPEDDELSGNSATNFFEITDIEYGQNSNLDMFQRTFNSDQEVAFGCLYDMREDAEVGGVNVMFGSNTDANIQCQVFLYEVLTNIQDLSEVASSEVFVVTQEMIDNGADGIYTTIGFNDSGSQDLTAGTTYLAEIRKYESTDRLYLACNYWDDDFGVANYGPFGTGGASNWFNGWDFTPAVRLMLDPNIAVEEVKASGDIASVSVYPNPADDNANISFNLLNNNNVKVIISDMTGRFVSAENLGSRAPGQNTVNLNVSNLTAGIYSVTVVAGSSTFTTELVIR